MKLFSRVVEAGEEAGTIVVEDVQFEPERTHLLLLGLVLLVQVLGGLALDGKLRRTGKTVIPEAGCLVGGTRGHWRKLGNSGRFVDLGHNSVPFASSTLALGVDDRLLLDKVDLELLGVDALDVLLQA